MFQALQTLHKMDQQIIKDFEEENEELKEKVEQLEKRDKDNENKTVCFKTAFGWTIAGNVGRCQDSDHLEKGDGGEGNHEDEGLP